MNFKERLAQSQAKMDELKAKVNEAGDSMKKAYAETKEELMADIAELDAALDELDKAISDQVESDIGDFEAAAELLDEEISKQVDDDIATIQGNINAAKENARLVKERRDSKLNSMRLKAQMKVNTAKAKITEKIEAKDKAKQEQRIVDLLNYADDCRRLALAMTLEAEMSVLEAAAEAAEYAEKYGEDA